MNKLFGKRQMVLATLILALGAAIFVNWYYTKAELDPAVGAAGEQTTAERVDGEALGEAHFVSGGELQEYFAIAKLNRDAAHDEAVETIRDMLSAVDSEALAIAANVSLEKFSRVIKQESDIEALVTAKTGSECVAIINNERIEIVVDNKVLNENTVMQITDIVLKNSDIRSDNITIIGAK